MERGAWSVMRGRPEKGLGRKTSIHLSGTKADGTIAAFMNVLSPLVNVRAIYLPLDKVLPAPGP